jgi:hypothetical protein
MPVCHHKHGVKRHVCWYNNNNNNNNNEIIIIIIDINIEAAGGELAGARQTHLKGRAVLHQLLRDVAADLLLHGVSDRRRHLGQGAVLCTTATATRADVLDGDIRARG